MIKECRTVGINVVNCTSSSATGSYGSLSQRTNATNNNGAYFFISIHHNVTRGGYGCKISKVA